MEKLLYAIDESSSSYHARNFVIGLLNNFTSAKLLVVYVSPPIEDADPIHETAYDPEEEKEREVNVANQIEKNFRKDIPAHLLSRIVFRHMWGRPPHVIVDMASDEGGDLIILGSHGRGTSDRMLLGSVSQAVLHRSEIPVLIVPNSRAVEDGLIRKILFATDGSPCTRKASKMVTHLLDRYPKAQLDVLYVMGSIVDVQREHLAGHIRDEEQAWADELKHTLTCGILAPYADRMVFRIEEGRKAPTICKVAENDKVDLIVMGSHGFGLWDRFLLGSVSTGVAHRSQVPVLIVKDNESV